MAGYFELHDVNNDGYDDVVAPGFFSILVLPNRGDGTFGAPIETDIDGFFEVLGVGDFDGDGNLDVLTDSAPQGYPQISFGHGDVTFGPTFTVSTGRDVHSFGIADLDDDGVLDFAAVYNLDEKGVSIRRGRGDGNFFVPDHYTGRSSGTTTRSAAARRCSTWRETARSTCCSPTSRPRTSRTGRVSAAVTSPRVAPVRRRSRRARPLRGRLRR